MASRLSASRPPGDGLIAAFAVVVRATVVHSENGLSGGVRVGKHRVVGTRVSLPRLAGDHGHVPRHRLLQVEPRITFNFFRYVVIHNIYDANQFDRLGGRETKGPANHTNDRQDSAREHFSMSWVLNFSRFRPRDYGTAGAIMTTAAACLPLPKRLNRWPKNGTGGGGPAGLHNASPMAQMIRVEPLQMESHDDNDQTRPHCSTTFLFFMTTLSPRRTSPFKHLIPTAALTTCCWPDCWPSPPPASPDRTGWRQDSKSQTRADFQKYCSVNEGVGLVTSHGSLTGRLRQEG
ncbi:MAG: hypothetical protein Ct9H300mP1_28560 [Planctomycetaceae bacterium]|nr:MAG: hypothetical protein Ct9H300mP1_28560 [Planctomycetaceae bacterium]